MKAMLKLLKFKLHENAGNMSGDVNMSTRITNRRTDRFLCGGIAQYYGIDPVIVRFIFVVLLFIHGIGFFIYIILANIMPNPEKPDRPPKEAIQENVPEMSARVKEGVKG
jgi:phage shock protein C